MPEIYRESAKKNEKGIALLFTLIVLSLLLILALGFALNSMFDHKAAYNSANKSFAAFLAQIQLKQVLTLIENDEANLENSKFYSHDSGSPVVTDTNMLKDMLQERMTVADLLTTIDTDKVNWNYIRSQDSEKRIIGRTAFIVLTGIPLDSLVDGRVGTTAYPKHNEKDNTESRIGKYVSEINIRAALPSATSSIAGALNWNGDSTNNTVPGFTGGKYTGNWQSFTNLFSTLEAVSIALTNPQKAEFRENVSIVVAKDKEAFWMDTSKDTNIDSDELYKRFDLTRDWNTADNAADLTFIKEKILLTSGTAPDIDMEKWTNINSNASSAGLPWLACFGYKDDGTPYTLAELGSTFPSVSAHRYQIAANLKDYCDDDGGINRPTSDVDPTLANPTNWVNCVTHPKFTGNEKTPYINKVGFNVRVLRSQSGTDVSATIAIVPCVELINIYGENCPDDLRVTIIGKVTIRTTINKTAFTDDYDINTNTDNPPYISIGKYVNSKKPGDWKLSGYSNLCFGEYKTDSVSRSSCTDLNVKVEVTAVEITKVVLHNGTIAYDYTKNLTETSPLAPGGIYPFAVFSGETDPEQSAWFGFAAHDPRQNLNPEDWLHLTPSVNDYASAGDQPSAIFSLVTGGPPYAGAANADNSVPANCTVSPADGDDAEPLDTSTSGREKDPANCNISTAFIRNGPMESPWELGFIHRGFRWQTVNLKKYDSAKAYKPTIGTEKYIPGGGLYSAGDANILDQIKMTAGAYAPQKINLRTQKNEILDALFSKVRLGCAINSTMSVESIAGIEPGTGTVLSGTEINLVAADYTNMRANIISMFQTLGLTNRTRASAVGELTLPAGAATDAAQEELTGKIVNLTKVGGKIDNFTIVILAQMIKDIGGPSGSPFNVSRYSWDASTSGTEGCELGVFNAKINDINDSKKNIYYDEITAEQKIVVKGYRTIDGNIKITSFQYVE